MSYTEAQQKTVNRWVAALRSGTYQQGQRVLRNDHNGYCCLGVLCDLVKGELGLKWGEPQSNAPDLIVERRPGVYPIQSVTEGKDNLNAAVLPEIVMRELGFKTKMGQFKFSDELFERFPKLKERWAVTGVYNASLAALNDNGWTFGEIADLLESGLADVFNYDSTDREW